MTAFKTATNTVSGIAFGLFLVCSVPTMAVVTLGSAILAPVNVYNSFNDRREEDRKAASVGAVISFLIFVIACAGDYGLMRLVLKLNQDNKK